MRLSLPSYYGINKKKHNKGAYFMPTKAQIEQWIPGALESFKSVMPPIDIPYPPVYIVNSRDFEKTRERLVIELGSTHTDCAELEIGEYIYGSNGGAILINQTIIESNQRLEFYNAYWHELGHFYVISTQQPDLIRYSEPGLVDDSHNFNTDGGIITLGLSDERIIQEGYWFWQEFIAQAIANTVRYSIYPMHQTYWHPENWHSITAFLFKILNEALFREQFSIDEYALSHYFAYLLLDDNAKDYVQAAKENKLLEYNDHGNVGLLDFSLEPTCISLIEPEDFQEPLWRMKSLVEKQLSKKVFWDISKTTLLEIGQCIADMMLIKFKAKINHLL